MNIKESNKLIAEFMGLKVKNQIVFADEDIKTYNERALHCYNVSMASYDSSWDWLMPVIKKIALGNQETKETNVIRLPSWYFGSLHLHSDIDVVYKRVVEYIKWYNKQEKI